MQTQTKQLSIFAALALLMAATRFNHFGSAVALPDASLAVFFLGGFYLAQQARLGMLMFAALLALAGGMDYYATSVGGVSDWCITPAYSFLIPTYAVLWFGGRWFAQHQQRGWLNLGVFAASAAVATTLAFLISNLSFYLLSGYFPAMGAAEYAHSVAQYYLPYLSSAAVYLAGAAVVHGMLTRRSGLPVVHG